MKLGTRAGNPKSASASLSNLQIMKTALQSVDKSLELFASPDIRLRFHGNCCDMKLCIGVSPYPPQNSCDLVLSTELSASIDNKSGFLMLYINPHVSVWRIQAIFLWITTIWSQEGGGCEISTMLYEGTYAYLSCLGKHFLSWTFFLLPSLLSFLFPPSITHRRRPSHLSSTHLAEPFSSSPLVSPSSLHPHSHRPSHLSYIPSFIHPLSRPR